MIFKAWGWDNENQLKLLGLKNKIFDHFCKYCRPDILETTPSQGKHLDKFLSVLKYNSGSRSKSV